MKVSSLIGKVLAIMTLGVSLAASAGGAQPRAYIISPANGETVTSPVTVKFGLENFGVAPAGVAKEKTGHHHLLVDVDELPDLDKPIPSDAHHRHFGGGQTEVEIELEPGTHTLQLLLGDHTHIPHDPPVKSEPITIHVR